MTSDNNCELLRLLKPKRSSSLKDVVNFTSKSDQRFTNFCCVLQIFYAHCFTSSEFTKHITARIYFLVHSDNGTLVFNWLFKSVVLLQDNARLHSANESPRSWFWAAGSLTIHFWPDSKRFSSFGLLKEKLRGKHFSSDEEVIETERNCTWDEMFRKEGIQKLVKRLIKYINVGGDYLEK